MPDKGYVLNLMTHFWFEYLPTKIPNLKTHFLSVSELDSRISQDVLQSIGLRSMRVRRLKVFPIEAIVRGYITGTAWSSYKETGKVNGIKVAEGLQQSQEFPEPIYTPSTKAELGQHDENISKEAAAAIVGQRYATRIEELALRIYKTAKEYARGKGIIIADTKFEFGLDPETDDIVLIDEVLTPDSSRFWPAETYQLGTAQDSFDKQYLRDWLTESGLKGKKGVAMPEDVVQRTKNKYEDAFAMLTGRSLREAMKELSC